MKTNRHVQIGLDRLVRLAWLEKTSSLVLAGSTRAAIKSSIQEDLKSCFHSDNTKVRGSIDKTITVLLKIWAQVPDEIAALHKEGLDLLRHIHRSRHLAVHWGLVAAVYPFWSAVASQTGRLLKLQGSASAAQVQRRVREQYGERETVSRRTRYVLRSFVDWGVLQEAASKGIYTSGRTLSIEDPSLIAWMIEASLHARASGSAPLKDLIDSPSLFPFRIKPVHAESLMAVSSRLDFLRHGLDDDLVMLRKPTTKGGVP